MDLLLRKTRLLEKQIDQYLDIVQKGAEVFRDAMQCYLDQQLETFAQYNEKLDHLEEDGDALRRTIEATLYLETLIPESRGDILGLMENTDAVLNRMEKTLSQFTVEQPLILDAWKPYVRDLSEAVARCVECMVAANRAFFYNSEKIRDDLNRVMFNEKESDKLSDKVKRMAYTSDLELAYKNHFRHFIHQIELIADDAEDVADRLTIASIKRQL